MSNASEKKTDTSELDDLWDDTVLIKLYNSSIKMTKEELARRLAAKTNTNPQSDEDRNRVVDPSTSLGFENLPKPIYKVADYVRATYLDGIDYEAKILDIQSDEETCLVKYVGYDNEQEVPLSNLLETWGKKARREQYAKAKNAESMNADKSPLMSVRRNAKYNSEAPKCSQFRSVPIPPPPPIPPMPPMPHLGNNAKEAEYLSAMLMAWYMSGYHTGVYMAKAKDATKK